MAGDAPDVFANIVGKITGIGFDLHKDALIAHARANLSSRAQSIKQLGSLSGAKAQSALVISAGPGLRRRKSIERVNAFGYKGAIVAVDGAYIACL